MANKNKTEDQFAQIEETLSKTEQFIEENQKSLMTIIGAIVGVVALFSVYQNFYIEPMEKEAQAEMYMAELYFQKDSFNLALNGDGQYLGFLDIANDYSSTNVGQLANYYAGLSYLHTADYDNAIEYLGDFSSDDIILSSLALGCIGDAYMELGDTDAALDAYADAVNNSANDFTAPRYMMKQAMIYTSIGDNNKALDLFKAIQSDYKTSREANGIEKYIARVENS
ncbi:MAG: tetratricopeptide repeat protein [Flavobacteriales bacterium]|jgi:tetratricopeptide (TPR) repeat protein|nr:tetratricopeptide repeat protein [Flavobacteriales bacterium]MBT6649865.1 tetratricopeptide repeat protein [Flavobacteriales bacterium]MDG2059364.1 tetratricopeptide repeat protein [Flavobacteriales bacterium]